MLPMPRITIGRKTANDNIGPEAAHYLHGISGKHIAGPVFECLIISFGKPKINRSCKKLLRAVHTARLYQLMCAYKPQRCALLTTQEILTSIGTGDWSSDVCSSDLSIASGEREICSMNVPVVNEICQQAGILIIRMCCHV
jgi:hypothetical protein